MSAAELGTKPAVKLDGHSGPVHALTFSSGSGQYLLSGSADRTINLYNPAKASSAGSAAALIQSYTGVHGYEILSIAVADDNSRFVSGGGDKTVFLWDVASAQTLRRYGGGAGGHGARIESVAFAGDGDSVVVSGSFDSSARLWDTKSSSSRPIMVLSDAKDSVSSLAVTGHEVHTGSIDGRVRTYDLRMGMLYVDVVGQSVTSLTATTQGDALLVSSLDSSIRMFDKGNGKMLQDYKDSAYTNTTYRLRSTLACKDAIVLSGSEDGSIFAWDVVSGRVLHHVEHKQTFQAGRSARKIVSAVACRRRSREWASAGNDGSIVVWG